MNYTNSNLPAMFRGLSPQMVNTLLRCGYGTSDTVLLLTLADEMNAHPDWSEATDEEIREHFDRLRASLKEILRNAIGGTK
jgi:hypothetical protein